MSQDTHVVRYDTRAEVHLRCDNGTDRFTLMTRILGYESDTTRAAFIGVNPRTISRAREGVIGEEFMARTVSALRRHEKTLAQYGMHASLDDLFVIIDVPVAEAEAAA